ncbi:alpha/beta fold hydrolase [Pseudoalteromonas rubra]|uniref:alpha/beta fold hydrolase n=1 Tax=Pseudoalteromonas rubra TaxID=43658 RepID=UPI002DB9C873|nr:alpha/beta fold hydrolase [Pseudoalteromonas rubra]MEC4090381.1 alpha/beta fold hydrolase [Pseudoalteromonas rubra]
MKTSFVALTMLTLASTSQGAELTQSDFNRYLDFNWGECPAQFQSADGKNTCTLADVPLNWQAPDGKNISVLVSKYPAKSANSKGHIWLLQGGPGGSGSFFVQQLNTTLAPFTEHYDLFVLEHRGVGWSTHLACSNPVVSDYAQYAKTCFDDLHQQWGDDLFEFNTTAAARDLEYVIGKSKVRDWQPSYVYGVSYGTLWAQRFSQIAPTGAQAIILDSVLPPAEFGSDLWDENFNATLDDLLAYCQLDTRCQSRLNFSSLPQLKARLDDIFTAQSCAGLDFDRQALQMLSILGLSRSVEQILIPTLHRLNRCNSNDVIALNNLHNFIFKGLGRQIMQLPAKDPFGFSQVVSKLITHNEINHVQRDLHSKQAYCQDAIACYPDFMNYRIHLDKQVWGNRYTDPYVYQPMHHYMPTLALNGDLDPQTPHTYISLIQDAFTNINQRYVELPQTHHGVLFVSHTHDASTSTCGAEIMKNFIEDIWSQPDTGCIAHLQGLNFTASAMASHVLFGTPDAFDGQPEIMSEVDIMQLKQSDPAAFVQAYATFMPLIDF